MIITNLNDEPLDDTRLRRGDTFIWGDEQNMWHVETWDGNETTDDRTYEQLDEALEDAKEREYRKGAAATECCTTEEDVLIDKVIAQIEDARDRRKAEAARKESDFEQATEKATFVMERLQRFATKLVSAAFNDLERSEGPYLYFCDETKRTISDEHVATWCLYQQNVERKGGSTAFVLPREGALLIVSPSGEFTVVSRSDSYRHNGMTEFVRWLSHNIMKNDL